MARRTALITGASSGLGRALAQSLLEDDWRVLGASRRAPKDLLEDERFQFVAVDLSKTAEISSALTPVLSTIDQLDLVILSAGVLGTIRDMRDSPLEDLKCAMDVNVWANKVLLDLLLKLDIAVTQVLFISSGAAISGDRGWNGYALSKATLNMLVRLYAHEFPKSHLVSVAPGLVDTPMQDYIASLETDRRFPVVERLRQSHGTSKMQTPLVAARRLLSLLPRLRERESGSYVDVRDLE